MSNRPVKYDDNESLWKFAKVVSKFPPEMLSESLVFKSNMNTKPQEKKVNNESSYIEYLEKRVDNLENLLELETKKRIASEKERETLIETYEHLIRGFSKKYEQIKSWIGKFQDLQVN